MTHIKLSLLILSVTIILPSFAQEVKSDSINLLKVYHLKKSRYVLLMEGEYVAYRTIFEEKKKPTKGTLNKIMESDSLLIDSTTIAIKDLEMIMSISHKKVIKAQNVGIATVGGLATIAGIGLLVLNQNNSAIFGTVGLVAGFSALISSIFQLSHSNHFSIKKGWIFKRIKTIIEDEEELLDHY